MILFKKIIFLFTLFYIPSVLVAETHNHKNEKEQKNHTKQTSSQKKETGNHNGHDEHDEHAKKNEHDEHAKKDEYDKHDEHDEHAKKDEHDEHDEERSGKFGKTKAIIKVKKSGKHFKLSKESINTLKITYQPLKTIEPETYSIPRKAIIRYQEFTGVYVQKDDWFKLVPINIQKQEKQDVRIKSELLSKNDSIVINGVGLLRVAHLEALGQGGVGHAH